ncbi:zinc finger MYM-type protein 1-like [Heracleum sosnowskyi]|uniref:Zinc finger MYM-type protein 1-like n=1 Tax=Heracleum sosnowskyi TaxID=360622 RepID=A0AAD8GR12_9APIA|nr:zinc finger MYM-type protein 1-like [Heracleum sosnowskyi]
MERFYKRKLELVIPAEEQVPSAKKTKADKQEIKDRNFASTKNSDRPINLADLEADPGLRIPISDYNVNDRDEVHRRYLLKGPCQPKNHIFPLSKCGEKERRFNPNWFEDHPSWLEYSIEKDAAFCLFCYLCKGNVGEQDCFVRTGYSNWKKRDRFGTHAGKPGSAHSHALKKCNALLNQKQHIATFFTKQSKKDQVEYRVRLESSIDSIRFLLQQGLPFRGHDESADSSNQGNFLELLKFMGCLNKDIKDVTLQNAPENGKLISPDIQKDIVNAAAIETINVIIKDIGDSLFSVLVDESRDISMKEQMAVVELNNSFDEVNTTLLLCVSCLCPDNIFVSFEKEKLIQLAEYYPNDFSLTELMALDDQLQNYIIDMRSSLDFSVLKGIGSLARTMIKFGKDKNMKTRRGTL